MAPKHGGLTISLPPDETLLIVWPNGSQTKLMSQGLLKPDSLWLSMPDTGNPPFLKALVLRLGQEVKPFSNVSMTLTEKEHYRVNIQAPLDVRLYRGDAVRP